MRTSLLSLLILLSWQCQAQLSDTIDSLVHARLPEVAPGCAILIAKGGQIVYEKGFGSADLELDVPMKADMIFRIGSVTKQYTAIAILQLAEQGKLRLDDSIQRYIPDFPPKGHTITIANLLSHTSGIIDYQAVDNSDSREHFYYRKDYSPDRVIDFFKHDSLRFTPGTQFSYSNSNYFLLGYIIERISGMPYKDYMQKEIFDKIGLNHTRYADYQPVVPGRVAGYAGYNGKFDNADYLSMTIPYAAGALMTNVEDMFKWHEAIYAGRLVSRGMLEKAFTPYRLADGSLSQYGFGWFIKELHGIKSIEHSGGVDGFQADELYFPQEDVFVATLYNAMMDGGNSLAFMDLSNDIATVALGKPLARAAVVPMAILRQYAGTYGGENDSDHPVIVTVENGELMVEAPRGNLPKTPLFPVNMHEFTIKSLNIQFDFISDEGGKPVKLVIHVNGQEQVATKIK